MRVFLTCGFGATLILGKESEAFRPRMRYACAMKRILPACALALASCTPSPPMAEQQHPAIELAGLIAGPRERCVPISSAQSLHMSETNPHVLLYGDGRTIYANFLGQCRFGSNDVLVTEPFGAQYCRGDLVRSFDRSSRIPGPACVLNDFVAYHRR